MEDGLTSTHQPDMNRWAKTIAGRRHIEMSSLVETDLASLMPRDPETISSGNSIGQTLEATDGFLGVDTYRIIHHVLTDHAGELMNRVSEVRRASSPHDLTGPHLVTTKVT